MLTSLSLPTLDLNRALLSVVCAGLICHLIFNRLEPRSLLHLVLLLALPPSVLTLFVLPHMTGLLSAATLTFALYLSSLVTSIVLYRLSPFHPLSKYPGPMLCKVSKLWFAAIAMKGKQHLYYSELHKRFGDVVRIGPNELSFRDVNAIVPMMGSKGMPKGPWWDGRMPLENREVRPLLALRDPKEHSRRRRVWNRAFSTPSLKDYEVLIDARVSQLVDILTTKIGTSVDLSRWLGWLTYDIMNDIMFSGGEDSMQTENRDIARLLGNAQPMALFLSHLPWTAEFYLRLPGVGRDLRAFRTYAAHRASERKARGSHQKDVFYHLIDEAGLESTPPSSAQVTSDGGLAIVAGSETTSTTLSHAFFLLLCNPTAYRRLQDEVDDPKRNTWVPASQARMPYLNAVINEALRLFPAVLSGSQRAPLIGSGGQTIGSHFVPEGTSAVVHTYSLHRQAENFSPFPDRFLPERWLSAEEQIALEPTLFNGEHEVIHNTAAFIPFSVGPSNCVGRNLAYQEMRMVVCTLMSKFEMRFEEGFDIDSWEENMLDYFVVQRGRLPVVLTARSS